jgi:hypothetical protein
MYWPWTCINLCSSHQVSYLRSYLHCNHLHSIPTYDMDSLMHPQGISKHGRTERATLLVYINSCLCNYVEAFIETTLLELYHSIKQTRLPHNDHKRWSNGLKECYKYSKGLHKYELHMINIKSLKLCSCHC